MKEINKWEETNEIILAALNVLRNYKIPASFEILMDNVPLRKKIEKILNQSLLSYKKELIARIEKERMEVKYKHIRDVRIAQRIKLALSAYNLAIDDIINLIKDEKL